MKKKKVNSKSSYKKGGEKWVSEKMANLPMYQGGKETPKVDYHYNWKSKKGDYDYVAPAEQNIKPYNAPVAAVPGGMNPFANISNNNYAPATTTEWTQAAATQPEGKNTQAGPPGFTGGSYEDFQKHINTLQGGVPGPIKSTGTTGTQSPGATPAKGASIKIGAVPLAQLDSPEQALGMSLQGSTPEEQAARDKSIVGDTNTFSTDEEAKKTMEGFDNIESGISNGQRQQEFFNPYGGYDLASSAGILGQSIQNKNTLGIVGSSLKLATGLGRNVVGGMGMANREQFIKGEYDDNVRDASRPRATAFQQGGYSEGKSFFEAPKNVYESIKPQQMRTLRVDGGNTGVSVPADMVDELGNVLPGQEGNIQKYTRRSLNRPNNKAYFQEGGEQIPQEGQGGQEEQMAQQIAQALQQGANPEEVVQQLVQSGVPEEQAMQMIQAVMQQLQGGEQQAPQEQQMMRKGGEIAKKLTGEYTLEEGENPNVNSEIENNEFVQTPDGEISVAKGETHEKGGIEVELEGGTRIVSDHLKLGAKNAKHYKDNFDLDVKSSSTYAKVLANFTKKSGLQKIVDEQERVIKQLEDSEEEGQQGSAQEDSTLKLNKQFLGRKLSELEEAKKPLEEARKALMEDVFSRQEESKPASERTQNKEGFKNGGYMDLANKYNISPERAQELLQEYQGGGELPRYQEAGPVPPRTKSYSLSKEDSDMRFNDWYATLEANGYRGKRELNEARDWQISNFPEDVLGYYSPEGGNQDLNAKHVDIAKKQAPEIFKAAGLDINKPSSQFTPEEKARLRAAGPEVFNPSNLLEGHNDGKQDWRAPLSSFKTQAKGIEPWTLSADAKMYNRYEEPARTPEEAAQRVEEEKVRKERGQGAQMMHLPDQSPMAPDSLTGALHLKTRYDRIDPMQVSATAQIGDIRGQETQAGAQMRQMAGSEGVAGMANLSAIAQQSIAKAYTDTTKMNMTSDAQAQPFNAQVQHREEDARGVNLNAYENKIYKAQAVTDANTRNYYNQLKAVDLANYNAVNNTNYMNKMYDNFKFDGNGVEQTDEQTKFDWANYLQRGQVAAVDTKKKPTSKKKPSARFGGKKK